MRKRHQTLPDWLANGEPADWLAGKIGQADFGVPAYHYRITAMPIRHGLDLALPTMDISCPSRRAHAAAIVMAIGAERDLPFSGLYFFIV